nr:AlpA family phage regulatory protein [uncultured Desulfuromonas sp.]
MNTTNNTPERLLRLPQVMEIVPLGKSTIWKMVAEQRFPAPLKISRRCTVWKRSSVMAWLEELDKKEGAA